MAKIAPLWPGKSMVGIVEAGLALIEWSQRLGYGRFGRIFKGSPNPLPVTLTYKQPLGEQLMRIVRNAALRNSQNFDRLPAYPNTLDVLAPLDPEVIQKTLDDGTITADIKGVEAKRLVARLRGQPTAKNDGPAPAATEEWTREEAKDRLRFAAEDEIRRCPTGQEAVVEDLLREIIEEVLGQRMKFRTITRSGWERLTNLALQLQDPTAGQRIPIRKRRGRGNITGFIREPSTFPDQMFGLPRTQRGARQLVDVVDHINNGKVCGEYERRLLASLVEWSDPDDEPAPFVPALATGNGASNGLEPAWITDEQAAEAEMPREGQEPEEQQV